MEGTGDTAASLGIDLLLTVVMLGVTWIAAIHLAWPMTLAFLRKYTDSGAAKSQ